MSWLEDGGERVKKKKEEKEEEEPAGKSFVTRTYASSDFAATGARLCTNCPSDALVVTTPMRVARGSAGAAVAAARRVTSTADTKEYCIVKRVLCLIWLITIQVREDERGDEMNNSRVNYGIRLTIREETCLLSKEKFQNQRREDGITLNSRMMMAALEGLLVVCMCYTN